MKTIALDLNDTLVDTIAALLDFIEESRGYRVDDARLATYQLGEDEKQTIEIVDGFYDAPAHQRIAAAPGALDACRSLKDAGFELVVVTARKPEAAAVTNALIERLFPGVFAGVHAVGHHPDKVKALRAVGARLLIDDNARQIRRRRRRRSDHIVRPSPLEPRFCLAAARAGVGGRVAMSEAF